MKPLPLAFQCRSDRRSTRRIGIMAAILVGAGACAHRMPEVDVDPRPGWSDPVIAPFSGKYTDMGPFITLDGQRVYFSSIRPVNGVLRGDIDLWYVEHPGMSDAFENANEAPHER